MWRPTGGGWSPAIVTCMPVSIDARARGTNVALMLMLMLMLMMSGTTFLLFGTVAIGLTNIEAY